MRFALAAVLCCLVFLQGAISEHVLGVSYATGANGDSPLSRFAVEIALALNAGWLFVTRRLRLPPGWQWFALYVVWSVLSGIITQDAAYDGFLYSRYTLYALLIYVLGYTGGFSPGQLKRLTALAASLTILQVCISLVKVLVFQDRTEWRVGTMTVTGGELATVFPLVALGFAMAYYFYIRHSLWVLLLGVAFGIVGYASGKRAIYFFLPLFFVANAVMFIYVQRIRSERVPTKFLSHVVLSMLLCFPALVYGITRSAGLSAEETSGSTTSETLVGAIDFAATYDAGVSDRGQSTGRSSTSSRVAQGILAGGAEPALLGWGPAALTPKRGDTYGTPRGFRPLGIWYGIVGWSRDALSIGVIGTAFYLLAFLSVLRSAFRTLKMANDNVVRAVLFGSCSGIAVILFCYLYYASAFMNNGVLTFVLLFAAGLGTAPQSDFCRRRVLLASVAYASRPVRTR